MQEIKIETYLDKEIRKLGGFTRKYISSTNGVADRLVFIDGVILLVETKTQKGRLSAIQRYERRKLAKINIPVFIVNSKTEVEVFCNAINKTLRNSNGSWAKREETTVEKLYRRYMASIVSHIQSIYKIPYDSKRYKK